MQTILLSREEVARRAKQIYESEIRPKVEVEANIGKMIIIDIETGDYEIEEAGLQAAHHLYSSSSSDDFLERARTRCSGICDRATTTDWYGYTE
jgi:hypothetical protein